ncbi:MAG TPA: type II toxin-antitoxin system RelE/ParE family toxin [Rhodocyclaceae bacterium]|nr:type II toxin-antitoxin system RelE/ParE family toxin [Rhodocyclaceae bacterium]
MEVRQTEHYSRWFARLKDRQARIRIDIRIRRFILGNHGDVKQVGEGVSELRIDVGPGYRVYFVVRGSEFMLLLAGGDKSSQESDIKLAKRLAAEL